MTEVLTTLLQKCATEKAQDLYFRPLSTGWAIIERLATGLKPLQKSYSVRRQSMAQSNEVSSGDGYQ